ncbi:MAG: pentapeptide repeat-containing protein [Methanothrix sp.]|nr:pentapeptide repeat-containing protein [Methanothrix sp.]
MAKRSKSGPGLKAAKPKSVFERSIQIDYKGLIKSVSKGVIHLASGKVEEAGIDATETLSSLGLKIEDPGELAFLLINRSLAKALLELVNESSSQQLIDDKVDLDAILEQIDFSSLSGEIAIDRKFFDRPAELPFLNEIQSLLQSWLECLGVSSPSSKAIAGRLPNYFVYALNQEWRNNAKTYGPIIEALDTPFARAGDREWSWSAYSALLQHRIDEGIFDEPFSLRQVYVPLNAFYLEEESAGKMKKDDMACADRKRKRIVVSLEKELEQWLDNPSARDAIRVISGGPGSGKSSFARIFAARHSHDSKLRVLYVPLHLIDASKDLVEEIGRFVRAEGILPQNPLDPESPESNLLIIFDGLDELASQGRAAAETARSFVREVDITAEKRNQQSVKLRILISGREVVIQENESEFRRQRCILTLLPYFVHGLSEIEGHLVQDGEEFSDPEKLLKNDLRQQWWKNYGALTGKSYAGLPEELNRKDLAEVTAQPLLNYLVALSFARKKLDFSKDINLNLIYDDLISAVHERGYEKHPHISIRHMAFDDFFRVLEEIGLAAWHGDGRTTTVREIQEHCNSSGLGSMLDRFQEGAEVGVTRLLAAFFFRQYGQRASGDKTFVFTHKSFGEYLAARRIVRAIERVIRELERRSRSPDEGWDEKDALKHWAQICGPSAITPYLHSFLLNEIKLRSSDELAQWQSRLASLFSHLLRNGMPMEQLGVVPFKRAMFQSRNAEEALLVALNSCARLTKQVSPIEVIDKTAFGSWFRRIQGQRAGPESVLAARCLSFLNLSDSILIFSDFSDVNLSHSNLFRLSAGLACFWYANLEGAYLVGANFVGANLERAHLEGADLEGANLEGTVIEGAKDKAIIDR